MTTETRITHSFSSPVLRNQLGFRLFHITGERRCLPDWLRNDWLHGGCLILWTRWWCFIISSSVTSVTPKLIPSCLSRGTCRRQEVMTANGKCYEITWDHLLHGWRLVSQPGLCGGDWVVILLSVDISSSSLLHTVCIVYNVWAIHFSSATPSIKYI